MRPMPRTSPTARVLVLQRLEPLAEDLRPSRAAFSGEVVDDRVDRRVRRGRARWGCRRTSRWSPPFHASAIWRRRERGGDREAVRDPLRHRHDVRARRLVVLDPPHLAAGASEAGLDLVADEEAAVLLTIPTAILKYPFGGVMKPPTPMIGSARKPAIWPVVVVWMSSSMSLAHVSRSSGTRSPKRTAVAVGRGRVLDARDRCWGRRGTSSAPPAAVGEERAARVAVPERGCISCPGCDHGKRDRGVVRLGPARGEEDSC